MTVEDMSDNQPTAPKGPPIQSLNIGLLAGITAFTIWGFFPFYFKVTEAASAGEILAHRILWSVPFGLCLIALKRQWRELWDGLGNRRLLGWLFLSSTAIAINWGVYIWAVQIDQIYQASLGYYMNPLVLVVVGFIFFGERLSRVKNFAVALAAIGVVALAIYGGTFPWISLILAFSWASYAIIRKRANIGAMPGLLIETLILIGPALLYLWHLDRGGELVFLSGDGSLDALLIMAGPLTVLPLVLFTIAAKRLQLATIGILQFIAPTLHFCCAVYFGETFTAAHAICFACIWSAVALFSWDGIRQHKRTKQATS